MKKNVVDVSVDENKNLFNFILKVLKGEQTKKQQKIQIEKKGSGRSACHCEQLGIRN